ncbi:MAG: type I-U CRISPR-associated helicase/endonuclease Cas3, partial [Chthoniobacterales bacterium]
MSAKTDDQHEAIEFFTRNYHALRERGPMAWMKRLFNDVRVGKQPRLIDLPTGAGKTELIVVWLIALAYHGARGRKGTPVPRRLVWVINRRVLVQQVFALAKLIEEKIADVPEVREGLAAMSGDPKTIFRLVQLRGQILADTEWATLPTVPQLVIGTVDQIGSRLFFEGYGLGKWNRPQQAALLGVDAWVAVDEAHLVPAFVLSLRQMRSLHMEMPPKILPKLRSIFDKLPFWLTELSATPGLPPPSGQPFRLEKDEENDPRIADRVLAANTRRVRLAWLGKGAKAADALADALASEALRQANANPSWAIAIFVRKVKDAKKVVARLEKKFKGQDRVCEITGRLRGYERERLVRSPVFRRFLSHVGQKLPEIDGPVFLVGTAAAEVGLDADAQSILCDFASLPTLLQRLGRLDRLGQQSSQCKTDGSEPPTMTIFASRPKTSDKARQAAKLIEAMVEQLARQLTKHEGEFSAELITGSLWRNATPETDKKVEGDENADATAENHSQEDGAAEETIAINDENSDSADNDRASADESEIETEDAEGNGKGKKAIAKLIDGATWKVLGVSGEAKSGTLTAPPARWLQESVASVAASPVVVPALTRATIEHWAATTEARTKYLSPHPFLYGHALDAESTPLVAVAFRLEIEALRQRHTDVDEEDTEDDDNERQLINIFKLFPPLRAELHHLPIIVLREWLKSADARP